VRESSAGRVIIVPKSGNKEEVTNRSEGKPWAAETVIAEGFAPDPTIALGAALLLQRYGFRGVEIRSSCLPLLNRLVAGVGLPFLR